MGKIIVVIPVSDLAVTVTVCAVLILLVVICWVQYLRRDMYYNEYRKRKQR